MATTQTPDALLVKNYMAGDENALAILIKRHQSKIYGFIYSKIADRDIEQESRVEAGNAIYATLIKYTNTGQSIWETSNVAKYNDYVVYNTKTGGEEDEDPDNPSI